MNDGPLTGAWAKVGGGPCSSSYPDELELHPGGRYEGRMREGAPVHPRWDVGTYERPEHAVLAISTSNDAVMRCAVTLEGDRMTLTDEAGCTFAYRRVR